MGIIEANVGVIADPDSCQLRLLLVRLVEFTMTLVGNRAWSTAVRYSMPPEIFSGLLHASGDKQDKAIALMKRCWKLILHVDKTRFTSTNMMALWNDLIFNVLSVPIRLVFMFFERDNWSAQSSAGLKLLSGLLKTLADTKIIEDVHGDLRLEAKANPNTKLSALHIQDVIANSKTFSTRKINHSCRVEKEYFVRKLKHTSTDTRAIDYDASRHKMPEEYSRIMGRKTWPTCTEDAMRRSAAAWAWLTSDGCALLPVPEGADLDVGASLLSALLHKGLIVQDGEGQVYYSLGQYSRAALCWPLSLTSEAVYTFRQESSTVAEWIFVSDLSLKSITYQAGMWNGCVVVRATGEEPLLKASLRKETSQLTVDTMLRLSVLCGLDYTSQDSRETILERVVRYAGGDDEEFINDVLDHARKPARRVTHLDCEDPLLDAAYDELDEDDKKEYNAIKEKRHRGKVRKQYTVTGAQVSPFSRRQVVVTCGVGIVINCAIVSAINAIMWFSNYHYDGAACT